MEAECPKCGTVYDVSVGEIGAKATCAACHAEFIVSGKNQSASPKRIAVPPRSAARKNTDLMMRVMMSNRGDVAFISPTIANILQWIWYAVCVVGTICMIHVGIMVLHYGNRMAGFMTIACTLVALPVALLFVRLAYEGIVALFEIVRHLREIRDKLDVL